MNIMIKAILKFCATKQLFQNFFKLIWGLFD